MSNERSFESEANESLLEAASRANVAMSYSCRTGRCSSCKSRVVTGESVAIHLELGLTSQEKADGWILSCVRSATTDMALEVDDLGGITLPPVQTLPCRIHTLEKMAEDVIRVELRMPPTARFNFLPGQYVNVIGHGGIRRSYSIANAHAAGQSIELHIRAVADGAMSKYWFGEAKVNALLRLSGPLGTFFLRNVAGLDLVFLATGTGIAPVKAMLEGMVNMSPDQLPRSVTVYWGARTKSELYWDVAGVPGTHRYAPVLSRASAEWSGRRGYVQDALVAEAADLSRTVVYACGSDAMIRSAKQTLAQAGLPEGNFFSDAFVCSAAS